MASLWYFLKCAITLKRRLMCWRIFSLSYKKPTTAEELWTGFAWDDVILWLKVSYFSIQSFLKWLRWYTILSQMSALSHSVVFAPNLAIQWLEFEQNSANLIKQLHIFHYGRCRYADLALIFGALTHSRPNGEWNVQNEVFSMLNLWV